MKKVLSILFLLICCLLFPQGAKADMGAPVLAEFEVIVSNPNGAEIYNDLNKEYLFTVPVGTELKVSDSYIVKGVLYGYTAYSNGEKRGYINLSDVSLKNSTFDLANATDQKVISKVYIYQEDGVYLYSGPSRAYAKVTASIPAGTVLSYQYTDSDMVWAYTTYKGVSGWLYIYPYDQFSPYAEDFEVGYDSGVASVWDTNYFYDNSILTVKNDVQIFNKPDLNSDKVSLIPSNTELNYKYYSSDQHITWYYVSYNGVSGWICHTYGSDNKLAMSPSEGSKMYVSSSVGIATYSEVLNESSKTTTIIPLDSILSYKYIYDGTDEYSETAQPYWIYLEYKNKNYWVMALNDYSNVIFSEYSTNYYKVSNTEGVQMRDSLFSGAVVNTIKYNSQIKAQFYYYNEVDKSYWIYTTYNDLSGWVRQDGNLVGANVDNEAEKTEVVPVIEAPKVKETVTEEPIVTAPVVTTELVTSPIQIASICVLSAIVLAAFSLVTIKLINKKKKAKVIAEVIEPSGKDIIEENNDKAIMEEDNKE